MRYRTSVIWTQDEIDLQSTDPRTGQPYEFWATATWVVELVANAESPTPRSWDYPGDPGFIEAEDITGYELDECQVWIPQEYIDSGAVQLDLNEIVNDSKDGMVEIHPRIDQERLVAQSFSQARFERSINAGIIDIPGPEESEPDYSDDDMWERRRRSREI